MERRLGELRSPTFAAGWRYFGLASQLKLFDKLDQWIRRRIRMCYWKQWRRPKRRREMLIRLGRAATPSDPPRSQPQGPLAHGQDHCQRRRADQCVACRTGTDQHEDPVGRACSATSNRLMRTRMSGGVGRVTGDGGPYPISHRFAIGLPMQRGLVLRILHTSYQESATQH